MSRARNIKPGFFSNEDLAECCMAARLCFAGLWTLADRAGRLEDRPRHIKGELFRFDAIEVEPLLVELEHFGFIERYEVEGRALIQVIEFAKHQNPHCREPASELPPPANQRKARCKHGASTGQAPGEHQAGPADSGFRIPDSGSLIPDSGDRTPVAAARPPRTRLPARAGFDPLGLPLPGFLTLEAWTRWVEHRRAIRKPITEQGAKLTLRKLTQFRAEGIEPERVIEESIANDWQSLQAPRGGNGTRRARGPPTQDELLERNLAVAAQWAADKRARSDSEDDDP